MTGSELIRELQAMPQHMAVRVVHIDGLHELCRSLAHHARSIADPAASKVLSDADLADCGLLSELDP